MEAEALLVGLINLGELEDSHGKFRVTLDYDNYHDGARVLDGNGTVLGRCYDVDKDDVEQFLVAIERAILKQPELI